MPRSIIQAINGRTEAGDRCNNRKLEWLTALMFINFAVTTAIWPDTISKGAFKYLNVFGLSPIMMVCLLGAFSYMRVMALYYNGRGLPWSARARFVCSVFGVYIFGHMALALAYLKTETGELSLGVGTHVILAGAELYSCLRAGADVNEKRKTGPIETVVVHTTDPPGHADHQPIGPSADASGSDRIT